MSDREPRLLVCPNCGSRAYPRTGTQIAVGICGSFGATHADAWNGRTEACAVISKLQSENRRLSEALASHGKGCWL